MSSQEMDESLDLIAKEIVDSAFKVHSTLGPGLLEQIYESCLVRELKKRNLPVERQQAVPVFYDGELMEPGLRLDLMVGGKVIVELKAVESLLPLHQAQLITYLKLSGKKLGFLINFNVPVIREGIKRVVL
ncbi:MAG TPA: GxxExxY protein [bacterium]|nr:GxxExxY protein [bacterium]